MMMIVVLLLLFCCVCVFWFSINNKYNTTTTHQNNNNNNDNNIFFIIIILALLPIVPSQTINIYLHHKRFLKTIEERRKRYGIVLSLEKALLQRQIIIASSTEGAG